MLMSLTRIGKMKLWGTTLSATFEKEIEICLREFCAEVSNMGCQAGAKRRNASALYAMFERSDIRSKYLRS